jgi:hypothetical protein
MALFLTYQSDFKGLTPSGFYTIEKGRALTARSQ